MGNINMNSRLDYTKELQNTVTENIESIDIALKRVSELDLDNLRIEDIVEEKQTLANVLGTATEIEHEIATLLADLLGDKSHDIDLSDEEVKLSLTAKLDEQNSQVQAELEAKVKELSQMNRM